MAKFIMSLFVVTLLLVPQKVFADANYETFSRYALSKVTNVVESILSMKYAIENKGDISATDLAHLQEMQHITLLGDLKELKSVFEKLALNTFEAEFDTLMRTYRDSLKQLNARRTTALAAGDEQLVASLEQEIKDLSFKLSYLSQYYDYVVKLVGGAIDKRIAELEALDPTRGTTDPTRGTVVDPTTGTDDAITSDDDSSSSVDDEASSGLISAAQIEAMTSIEELQNIRQELVATVRKLFIAYKRKHFIARAESSGCLEELKAYNKTISLISDRILELQEEEGVVDIFGTPLDPTFISSDAQDSDDNSSSSSSSSLSSDTNYAFSEVLKAVKDMFKDESSIASGGDIVPAYHSRFIDNLKNVTIVSDLETLKPIVSDLASAFEGKIGTLMQGYRDTLKQIYARRIAASQAGDVKLVSRLDEQRDALNTQLSYCNSYLDFVEGYLIKKINERIAELEALDATPGTIDPTTGTVDADPDTLSRNAFSEVVKAVESILSMKSAIENKGDVSATDFARLQELQNVTILADLQGLKAMFEKLAFNTFEAEFGTLMQTYRDSLKQLNARRSTALAAGDEQLVASLEQEIKDLSFKLSYLGQYYDYAVKLVGNAIDKRIAELEVSQ